MSNSVRSSRGSRTATRDWMVRLPRKHKNMRPEVKALLASKRCVVRRHVEPSADFVSTKKQFAKLLKGPHSLSVIGYA
jgi:hypothetical protein